MTFVSRKLDQFTYFAEQLGETCWRGKTVLDFGGNVGNMLRDPAATIDVERYWCLDVDRGAIEQGRAAFPGAHWLCYDRHCYFFNPDGVPDLPIPDPGQRFDIIVAYSVFTNTPRRDMLEQVPQLRALLQPGGRLAFTFIDPHHHSWPGEYAGSNLRWRLERNRRDKPDIAVGPLLERAARAEWCVLIGHDELYLEDEEAATRAARPDLAYHSFYGKRTMAALFPEAELRPPANGEMQHCCILPALP